MTDLRPPRRPFIAGLFQLHFLRFHIQMLEKRGPSNIHDRRETTHLQEWRKQGEKCRTNQMALHQLLYGGSTCSSRNGPQCEWPPLSEALWATRICPVIHYGVQWAPRRRCRERWVMVVAERQADTSRDKMVGKKKKNHPSPTKKQERRQMRWRRIKKR